MCYAFDSIQENKLIGKGDKIALMVPAFTPYIEIPHLDRFDFEVVNINADKVQHDGYHTWQYPAEEVDKLLDPSIKLLCIINPSNPPSYTLSSDTIRQLVDIVKNDNPDLMIITDDVYGTFVRNFRSLMYELPYNTMCVYSFSKYFESHLHLLRGRQSGGMVESYQTAVGHHTVYELYIMWFERQRRITPVEICCLFGGELCYHVVEYVVLADGAYSQTPACGSEIF